MNIEFDKTEILKSVRTIAWKYSNTIEGADNFMQVSNVRTDINDNADNRALSDSFIKRTNETAAIMREFVSGNVTEDNTSHNVTVPITMSATWGGQQRILQSYLNQYVIDGMLADWYGATAPNEASLYIAQLRKDEDNIISELYAIGGAV